MLTTRTRRSRRNPSSRETGAFKKESMQDQSFFGNAARDTFFQPANHVVQRKCEHCEEEDKKLQRQPEKKEEEKKVMRMEEKKEEEKIHRVADKKEEEKLQRAGDKKEEDKKLQKKDTGINNTSVNHTSNYINSLNGKGQPLSRQQQHFFGSRMGYDFSNVKVHTDKEAAQSAKEVNAKAFTYGNNIVFSEGKYNPETSDGKKLMAHELTHTIQQGSSIAKKTMRKGFIATERKIQKDDAAFESGSGVDKGIASGTMTADAIMGTTSTASNCRGLFGCNVGFSFEKAYKGVYPFQAGGFDVRGAYVKIVSAYDHKICGSCDAIRLIQTVRNITRGTAGNMQTADPVDPTRRDRSGWSDPAAKSKGWRVDTLISEKRPFYDTTAGFDSQIGSPSQAAILWDSPGDLTTDINAGKEFQTFFVCETGGSTRKVIGGVNWGYYINSTGAISLRPATPIATCGPTTELVDASKRWDAIRGNDPTGIDFTAESPVNNEGVRTLLWFNLDSTKLRHDSSIDSDTHYEVALKRIRQHIMATWPLTKVIIHGYSSKDGQASHNMRLSGDRAEAIRAKLIGDGIPAAMLQIEKHGANSDLSPADLNRRVEIETTHYTLNEVLKGLLNMFRKKTK